MTARAIQQLPPQLPRNRANLQLTIGAQLRAARISMNLTLREVEERTAALAEESANPACRISGSWLDRVEREDRSLSGTKLIVLALIYNLTSTQMLALCTKRGDGLGQVVSMPNPRSTLPEKQQFWGSDPKFWLQEKLFDVTAPEQTMLLQTEPNVIPSHFRCAVIGKKDASMEPIIPTGSIVFVDTQKRSIASRAEWTNEFDRPVYLLFARDGYHCGFCSLDRKSAWLTLVPHMLAPDHHEKRWRLKHDVEVVGTVVASFVRRVL